MSRSTPSTLPSWLAASARSRPPTSFLPPDRVGVRPLRHAVDSRPIDTLPVDNAKERIIDSTGALKLSKVPERMIVVGGGVIGLELGSVWRRLGAKVDVVEFLDHIGGPNDAEVTSALQKCLTKQGMKFHLNTKVLGSELTDKTVKLNVESVKGGSAMGV